jgi:hypothetical protein
MKPKRREKKYEVDTCLPKDWRVWVGVGLFCLVGYGCLVLVLLAAGCPWLGVTTP